MIEVGNVYIALNDQIYPPKKKLSLCVCNRRNWFFLINSENRSIYDCMAVNKSDNTFLKYDSYVSCSRVFYYEESKLSNTIGCLCAKDMKALLQKVEASEILEQRAIDIIGQNIKSSISE